MAIELTKDQVAILGRPNFLCTQYADVLIRAGVYADASHKTEYKQAVYIHWALQLLEKHGPVVWADFAVQQMNELAESLKQIPGPSNENL